MPLSYLKHTEFMIPTGYSVRTAASMTADSRRDLFRRGTRYPADDAHLRHERRSSGGSGV